LNVAVVYFFGDLVICNHCGKETLGIVEEFSSRVECDHCGKPIIDYEDNDEVVVFAFDDKETVH
jgi:hypothetical protein